jgi:hypothetical protein
MSTSPRSLRSLLSFKTIGPQDSTSEYREEKPVFFHPADRDPFHGRKGKFMRAKKPTIATVNVATIPDATTFQLESIDRSNKRAARRIYPKVNEINMTKPTVNIIKLRKTVQELRVLARAMNRERLQKFDTSYLVDEATGYIEEEEFPPRPNQDDDDDWSYDGGYSCACEYCRW